MAAKVLKKIFGGMVPDLASIIKKQKVSSDKLLIRVKIFIFKNKEAETSGWISLKEVKFYGNKKRKLFKPESILPFPK